MAWLGVLVGDDRMMAVILQKQEALSFQVNAFLLKYYVICISSFPSTLAVM